MTTDFTVWSDLHHNPPRYTFMSGLFWLVSPIKGAGATAAVVVARINKSSKEEAFSYVYPKTSLRKQRELTVWKLSASRQCVIVDCSSSVCQAELVSAGILLLPTVTEVLQSQSVITHQLSWKSRLCGGEQTAVGMSFKRCQQQQHNIRRRKNTQQGGDFVRSLLRLKVKKDLCRTTVSPLYKNKSFFYKELELPLQTLSSN